MAKKYTYWLNSGKYSMMQKVLVLIIGVLTFMMLARMLTPALLGVWGLFLIISGIIETSRNALIRNGYIYFINTTDKEGHAGVEYAAFTTNVFFTCAVIMIFLLAGSFFEHVLNAPHLAGVLYYYCITLLVLIFFSQAEIFLTSRVDFKGVFWMYSVRNGLLLLAVAFYFFSKTALNIHSLSIMYLLCSFLGTLTGLIYLKKHPIVKRKKNRPVLIKFLHYGKFVYGNNVCSLIFRNTDSFLTSSYISSAASAFYNACTRITNFADMPSQVLGDIMFPKAAQVMKTGDMKDVKLLYEKTVAATLTFTLPVILGVLLFAKQILLILAGNQYVNASSILRVIILYGLFLPFIRQFGNIMDVTGRPQTNFFVMFSFAVLNIIFNIIGIKVWGLPGSAYGTLFSYFLLFLVSYLILFRSLKISFIAVVKNIFLLYPEYIKLGNTMIQNFLKPSYGK